MVTKIIISLTAFTPLDIFSQCPDCIDTAYCDGSTNFTCHCMYQSDEEECEGSYNINNLLNIWAILTIIIGSLKCILLTLCVLQSVQLGPTSSPTIHVSPVQQTATPLMMASLNACVFLATTELLILTLFMMTVQVSHFQWTLTTLMIVCFETLSKSMFLPIFP